MKKAEKYKGKNVKILKYSHEKNMKKWKILAKRILNDNEICRK